MKHLNTLSLTCLILSLSLMFSIPAAAQVQTARYTKMSSKVNAYYEYLPQGYSPTGTLTYPVIISLPASGGLGNGTPAELPKALNGQPAWWISKGYFPTSFTVKGQTFKFIVITPQFIYGTKPDHIKPIDIDTVINFVVKNYKVGDLATGNYIISVRGVPGKVQGRLLSYKVLNPAKEQIRLEKENTEV